MPSYRKNVAVGFTMIIALGILGVMIMLFGDAPIKLFRKAQMPVQFNADSAEGISVGTPIMYLGVNVGRVNKVERSLDGAGVTIYGALDEKPPLPANAQGVIKSNLIGGSSTLSLEIPSDAPEIKPTGQLKPNAILSARMGGSSALPREFTDLARKLQKTVDDWNNSQVIVKVSSTVDTVEKTVVKIGAALDEFKKLLADDKMKADLKESIANFRAVSEDARAITKNINTFSGKLEKLPEEFTKVTTDASATINKAGTRIDELSKQMNTRMEQVGTILEKFQSVATKIDKGDGTAGKFINDPKLYESLVDTSQELNLTIKDLKRLVEQWEQEGVSLKLGGKK